MGMKNNQDSGVGYIIVITWAICLNYAHIGMGGFGYFGWLGEKSVTISYLLFGYCGLISTINCRVGRLKSLQTFKKHLMGITKISKTYSVDGFSYFYRRQNRYSVFL